MPRRVLLVVAAAGLAGAVVAAVIATRGSSTVPLVSVPDPSVAAASGAIDYNCNLPGTGCPWLEHMPPAEWDTGDTDLSDLPIQILDAAHWQGIFFANARLDEAPYVMWLPVAIGPDGPSWPDVYRTVCAVHPDLGGSGLRQVPAGELETMLGQDIVEAANLPVGDARWFTDDVTRSANEAHLGFESIRLYWLPVLPMWVRQDLTSQSCATTTAETTTSVAQESRRYRVVVNGYENKIPNPEMATANGVRFDYRLIGEFEIGRTDSSRPWRVANSRIVTAEVNYRSLYPPAQYRVMLSCQFGSCERLREATRLYVQVHNEEVVVSWGYFNPDVRITGWCSGCPDPIDRYAKSDYFFARINSATLPLENTYVGPQTISRYGNGQVQVSFAYGLELLP